MKAKIRKASDKIRGDSLVDDINAEIARLKADDRLDGPPAQVQINAPLALIQVFLRARIGALEWVLESISHKGRKGKT